jgi:hypothetical protein
MKSKRKPIRGPQTVLRRHAGRPRPRRFVLTRAEGKRIMRLLSEVPPPLSDAAKRTIAECRRVRVRVDI